MQGLGPVRAEPAGDQCVDLGHERVGDRDHLTAALGGQDQRWRCVSGTGWRLRRLH
jgi:hypothetical protein